MTYCIGWIYKNSVYLAADTAVTSGQPPCSEKSSFGEYHLSHENEHVEEGLIKIIPITSSCVVCYSGNVRLAEKIIEFFKENYTSQSYIKRLLNSLILSLGPFSQDEITSLIIASHGESGAKLFYWDSFIGKCDSGKKYYHSGSLITYHAEITPQVLQILTNGNIPENRVLPLITSIVQSYGVHDNLIQQNIGGLIFGVYLDHNRMNWQQDTSYILYDPKFQAVDYISAFVRDNAVVINSSVTNITKCFLSSLNDISITEWFSKWKEYISDHINSKEYEYWVFISKKEKNITVINWPKNKNTCKYLSIKYEGNGEFDFGFSPELMNILHKPLEDKKDGSMPFRLNFLNG